MEDKLKTDPLLKLEQALGVRFAETFTALIDLVRLRTCLFAACEFEQKIVEEQKFDEESHKIVTRTNILTILRGLLLTSPDGKKKLAEIRIALDPEIWAPLFKEMEEQRHKKHPVFQTEDRFLLGSLRGNIEELAQRLERRDETKDVAVKLRRLLDKTKSEPPFGQVQFCIEMMKTCTDDERRHVFDHFKYASKEE